MPAGIHDAIRKNLSESGRIRWSRTREIGWSRFHEIAWSLTFEIGWSRGSEILQLHLFLTFEPDAILRFDTNIGSLENNRWELHGEVSPLKLVIESHPLIVIHPNGYPNVFESNPLFPTLNGIDHDDLLNAKELALKSLRSEGIASFEPGRELLSS